MRRYSTVLFDLIDTLVRFDPDRLPIVQMGSRQVRSSIGRLYPIVSEALPDVGLEAFHDAFLWSYREAERRRAATHREVPAAERFAMAYERLGARPGSIPAVLTERLLAAHKTCLAAAAVAVEGRLELLEWMTGRYRTGVISNFDYTPTVERILDDAGLSRRFEVVVVSDRVGWRKPSRRIFETAFQSMKVEPGDCLFVGDRPDVDVGGAHGVGMDAAWLNPAGHNVPAGLPSPRFDLRCLGNVRTCLEAAPEIA